MKTIGIVIVLAALAAGGYFLWKNAAVKDVDRQRVNRPTTATVEPRDIRFEVTVAGEIAPAEQVSVRPEVNGRIATLAVDVGDRIKQGAVLFTLDDKELQNQRDSSLTAIDRAKLELEQAVRNLKRNQELFQENLISREVFDDSRTTTALGSNALERAQRDLAMADERLTKTVILAPFDCTVLIRPVSVGQAVSGSGGVGGGTEVLAIADLNQMIINAHVNQADVTRLKLGQDVNVNVEAVPGLKVKAVVDRIAPQATIKNNIKGFAARMAIQKIDPRIQPGMTANVTIPVASVDNVLALPLGAVFTELGERYAFVKQGEQYERRPIQIGVADYFYAEVISGLKSGEVVSLEQPPAESILSPTGGGESTVTGGGRRDGPPGTRPQGRPGTNRPVVGGKSRPSRRGT